LKEGPVEAANIEMRKDEGSTDRELIEQSNLGVVSKVEEEVGNPWGRLWSISGPF
jgi:hypothetical protein